MLNFDEKRFLRIQSGAVSHAGGLYRAVQECIEQGAENLFFLGTGGAAILMMPAAQLLQRQSSFPTFLEMTAEVVLTGHRALGPKSIVVVPSLSGTTKESVAAMEYCRTKGAKVISLIGHAETPLAKGADYAFVNFAEDDTSCESFYLQSLIIALAVMNLHGEYADFDDTIQELVRLPHALLSIKKAYEEKAERVAEEIKSEPYHIVTGAGSTWPEAFYYGMCILEEMQWIRTRPVHSSDFFHGTLELVEKGVSVLLFKGEDAARPLVERVERFLPEYTDKVRVFDTVEFELPGISDKVRTLISPVILATIFERISAHLEVKRNHPLSTRRYYKRVAY
ncbi:SIS domain-containing protein [Microvirga guangxiensis]|uniref:Fructoselysine-6-P-deglycase FrlB with duplicated sugar isomerase (SIS) domain n=1 Tax=Microvirga guangxiensis TaxID=549386 RepID=A0A1G5I6I4_9HYPH|nr:SIS domain-containing protein [Microvirga guangxiensis]SCY71351.1 Fructoselysine-6-P-deglycase FrlB with duplicated sugar isomerase (SIS) domain [Microvirga guangxiensis]